MTPPTPGPWHLLADRAGVGATSASGEPVMVADCLTSCVTADRVTEEEMTANAVLITAAPNMLAAIKALLVRYGWPENPDLPEWCAREWLALIDAMLKAEGVNP